MSLKRKLYTAIYAVIILLALLYGLIFKITVTQQRQIEGLQERQEVLTDQLQQINNHVHYPGG